jgi:hypothetical protein
MKSSDNTLLLAGLFVLIVVIIALIVYYTRPGETKISEQTSDDTPLKVENLSFTRTLNPDPSVGDGVSGYTIEPYGVEYAGKADYKDLSRNVTFTMKWSNAPGFTARGVKGFEIEHWVRDTTATNPAEPRYSKKKTYDYHATLAKQVDGGRVVDFKDFKENKVNMICSDENVGANVGKCTYSVVGDNAFKLYALAQKKDDTVFNINDANTQDRVELFNGVGADGGKDITAPAALKISTNQLSVTLSMTTPDISKHIPTKPTDTTSRTIIDKTVYSISSSDGTNISSLVKQFGYKGGVYLTTQKGSGGKRFTFTFEDGDILGYKTDNTFVKQTTMNATDTEKFIFEIVDRKNNQGKIRQAASRFLGTTAKGIGQPETVTTTAEKDRKYLSFNASGKLKLYKQKDSGLTQAIFDGFTWTFNTRIADSLTMPTGTVNESRTGDCVAISGDYALVGQPLHNDTRGRVIPYTRNASGKWIMGTTFGLPINSNPAGMFGTSISIDGDYAVIGEPAASRVYIAKKVNGVWDFGKLNPGGSIPSNNMVKITPPSSSAADGFFGGSVSISGNYIVIGEPINNKVHLYWIKDTSKVRTITGSGNFGGSVSISGDRIIVGAKMDGNDFTGSVSIYKFNKSDLTITDTKKITGIPWGDEKKLYFGTSVAIQGEYAFVGAPGYNNNNGRVYVYKVDSSGGWTRANEAASAYYTDKPVIGSGNATTAYDTIEHPQTSNLADGEEIAEKMYFGKVLDISGNKLVISSAGGDGGGGENNVRIYTRSKTNKMWNDRETDKVPVKLIEPPIKSPSALGGSLFGYSVSIDGDYVIIGEPRTNNDKGASYITEA